MKLLRNTVSLRGDGLALSGLCAAIPLTLVVTIRFRESERSKLDPLTSNTSSNFNIGAFERGFSFGRDF